MTPFQRLVKRMTRFWVGKTPMAETEKFLTSILAKMGYTYKVQQLLNVRRSQILLMSADVFCLKNGGLLRKLTIGVNHGETNICPETSKSQTLFNFSCQIGEYMPTFLGNNLGVPSARHQAYKVGHFLTTKI